MLTVYLAEHSALIRKKLISLVADIRHVVVLGDSGTGKEALEGIRMLTPDLVLLDLHLPPAGGLWLLKELKEGTTPPAVLMLTDYPRHQYQTVCSIAGANGCFEKAADLSLLMEEITHLAFTQARPEDGEEEHDHATGK